MGIFFIPASVVGWLIAICSCFYAIYVFIDIDSRSHSVSDTMINFVFSFVVIAAAYTLIGYLASHSRQK
jgi:hypothetical protein